MKFQLLMKQTWNYGRSELVISTHEARLIRSESHRGDSAATGLIWPWLFFWITRFSKLQHWQEILFLPSFLSLTHWVLPGRMRLAPISFSLTKLIPTQISFICWQPFPWPATSPNKIELHVSSLRRLITLCAVLAWFSRAELHLTNLKSSTLSS